MPELTPPELTPLGEVVGRFGLDARKALGQHFLLDETLCARIARLSGDLTGRHVLEVGPGPGGLTRALLATPLAHLTAVELDPRALAALAELDAAYPGRLTVLQQDAMKFDGTALPAPRQVVANLPYNVGTNLLTGWLTGEAWPPWYQSLTLMFQKEVAQRIVAPPGSDPYGRLGVLAGWRTTARIMFDVAPSAFVPPPKITSSVVHLVPRAEPLPCAVKMLERVTLAAFGQRRKMIRQSLKGLGRDPMPLIEAAGLDPTERAENLTIEDFCRLARLAAG